MLTVSVNNVYRKKPYDDTLPYITTIREFERRYGYNSTIWASSGKELVSPYQCCCSYCPEGHLHFMADLSYIISMVPSIFTPEYYVYSCWKYTPGSEMFDIFFKKCDETTMNRIDSHTKHMYICNYKKKSSLLKKIFR